MPSGPALMVCSLRSESTAVKIALGDRLAVAEGHQANAAAGSTCPCLGHRILEGRLDLEGDLSPGRQPVELVGVAGHRLGIIAEQERSLLGAGQDAVLAFADDGQAAIGRQRGPTSRSAAC